MRRLNSSRADRLGSRIVKQIIRSAAWGVEELENRVFLSATVESQIPTQSVTAGQSPVSITLGTYLNDPSLTGGTVIEMQTPLGNIPLELTNTQTPHTVANFMQYITNGEYTPTIIQRSAPGFVIQGGGTKPNGSNNAPVSSLQGEPGLSNVAGTIAMALSSGPNSGTNQWFINLGDNSSELDGSNDGGPFTVFGNVIDGGMTIANNIAALPIINGSAENSNWYLGATNDGLPVINYTGVFAPTSVPQVNLVTDNIVVIPPSQAAPTYTAVSANTALVTASVSNGVLTLTPVSGTASGSTTVTATIRDLGGETVSSTFTVNVAGLPQVSVSSASGNTGAAGQAGQVSFPITLSAASASATTFDYTLTADTAPAGDFQATGSTITIPAGSTQASIPVNILADTTGGDETFTLTLSSLSTNAVFSNASSTLTATGTIHPATTISSTTVSPSATSVAFGGTETLTATVTPGTSGSVVTGTVVFSVGGTVVGTAPVQSNNAVLAINLNTAGSQSITAAYSGDANNLASTSTAVTVDVAAPSALTPAITKSALATMAIAGQPFKGTLILALDNPNQVVPQVGPVKVNLYATTDGIVSPDSVVIASVDRTLSIKPGKAVNLSVPVKSLPATLAAGTYTLVAQAMDPSGALTTPVAGASVTVAAPTIALSESFESLPLPASVVAGAKTRVVAVVKITNHGNILSSGLTPISLYASTDGTVASGTLIKTLSRKLAIKPGGSVNISIPLGSYPLVADGDYYVVAQATDPLSQLSSVQSANTVNIAAAKIDLDAVSLTAPAAVASGKSISVAITVSNLGNTVAAGVLEIVFEVSASSTGSNPFSVETASSRIKLQPGSTQVLHLKVQIPTGSPTGSQFLVATLDPANAFNDINPANNVVVSASAISIS